MKTKLPLTALALAALLVAGWGHSPVQMTFQNGSRIWIEGTSNVHDWSCEVEQFTGSADAAASFSSLSALRLAIPVRGIDCGNGTMNGKLRDALEVDAHPMIRFTLSNASVSGNGNRVTATGQLAVAGTTRRVQFTAQGRALGNGRYRFTGSVPLVMSQFGIDPPTAMLGAMRTGDRVTINYNVILGG